MIKEIKNPVIRFSSLKDYYYSNLFIVQKVQKNENINNALNVLNNTEQSKR